MARPLEIPVIRFYTPDKRDKGLIELWNTEVASYVPLDEGSPHPNTREFPGYKLGKQLPLEGDEKFVVRIWVTDEVGAEWFGYAIKYLGEANANPVFVRTFREPRNTYAAKTKGTALKAVYKLTVTNAGTGYTPGTFPALTFAGGAGTGAAGHAVVNPSGTIAEFVLDDGGDNYTSSPTFTVAAPPSGTTATGTALIQPATAVLTTEEAQEYPQDSEFYGLYFNVVRVYETLPGPYLPFTRYDENLGPIQGRRRAVVNTGQAANLTATVKITYEARDGSSYVSWEIEETNSNGTGIGGGNPVYPTLVKDFYDDNRGAVQQTKQLVVATGSEVGSATASGGVITKISYEPYNQFLLFKITETYAYPGVVLTDKSIGSVDHTPDKYKRFVTRTETITSRVDPATNPGSLSGTQALIDVKQSSIAEATKTVVDLVIDAGATPLAGQQTGEYGVETTSESYVADGTTTDSGVGVKESYVRPDGTGKSEKRTVNYPGTFPILKDYDIDEETGQTILTTYQVVDATTATTATMASGVVTRYKHIDKWRSMKIISTYSTPANYDEQRFAAHSFPTLFDYTTLYVSDDCGMFADMRGGFAANVEARVEVSFTTTKQTISGLTLIPKKISAGKFAQFTDVITDENTLGFTYSGVCTGTVYWGGSDPDYSTYVGSIQGTSQLISGESVKWKGGLYRNSKLYVVML